MLHLVDASYFIFRAYYSVAPDMTGRDGQAVNALYGYARFLGDLLERRKIEFFVREHVGYWRAI